VLEHRLEAVVGLGQAGLCARALGRRADDAGHLDPEAAQRLDMHDADEPGPHNTGSHVSSLTASYTERARLASQPTATAPASRNSRAFDASTPPVTISGTSASTPSTS